jgi:hypothetical protein
MFASSSSRILSLISSLYVRMLGVRNVKLPRPECSAIAQRPLASLHEEIASALQNLFETTEHFDLQEDDDKGENGSY